LVLSVCALAIGSCKKDDNKPEEAGLSAKVDGSAKSNISPVGALVYESDKTIQIVGQFSQTEGITLVVTDLTAGDYDVATDKAIAVYTNGENTYFGTEGSVKITSVTGENVTGTFTFTGETQNGARKVVTEGKFTAKVMKL
jgi:hypothetical protein